MTAIIRLALAVLLPAATLAVLHAPAREAEPVLITSAAPATPDLRLRPAVVIPTTTTTKPTPVTTKRTSAARPARAQRPVVRAGGAMPAGCIRKYESGGTTNEAGNYRSAGGGAYQIQPRTWAGYGGVRNAQDAPPHVQDERARQLWAERPGHWSAQRGRCF